MSLNTTPATWVANAVLTAAQLNLELRDALTGLQSAWTSYVVTWTTTGTGAVLGNGSISGKYRQEGKTIDFLINLTPGSTTTFGTGNYSFGLPFASVADGFTTLALAQLTGIGRWEGQAVISPGVSTTQPFFSTSSTDPRLTQMSPTAPITFASTHNLRLGGRYEAA